MTVHPEASDDELIQASQDGSLAAFNLLVERYQRQVYNVALRMLGNPTEAEDVAQETFLSAYKHIKSFRGELFRSWLLRIATNACHDVFRRSSRRPASSLDLYLEGDEAPRDIPDPAVGPESIALQREQREGLARLLRELPREQRAALVLSDIQGLSYEEIAQVTGEALGTVKSRLSRARARMRDLLRGQGELFPQIQRLTEETPRGDV